MAIKKTRFKPPVYIDGVATYPDTHHFETSGNQVKIDDAGEYFESNNVEGALQETADLVSTNVGDLETLTTTDKSSLVNATNEVKNLVDTNTQFTGVDNVVYSWRFIKSAEGHMQLEYTEVI